MGLRGCRSSDFSMARRGDIGGKFSGIAGCDKRLFFVLR